MGAIEAPAYAATATTTTTTATTATARSFSLPIISVSPRPTSAIDQSRIIKDSDSISANETQLPRPNDSDSDSTPSPLVDSVIKRPRTTKDSDHSDSSSSGHSPKYRSIFVCQAQPPLPVERYVDTSWMWFVVRREPDVQYGVNAKVFQLFPWDACVHRAFLEWVSQTDKTSVVHIRTLAHPLQRTITTTDVSQSSAPARAPPTSGRPTLPSATTTHDKSSTVISQENHTRLAWNDRQGPMYAHRLAVEFCQRQRIKEAMIHQLDGIVDISECVGAKLFMDTTHSVFFKEMYYD